MPNFVSPPGRGIRYITFMVISLRNASSNVIAEPASEHLGRGQDRRDLGRRQLHGHGGRASGTTSAGGGVVRLATPITGAATCGSVLSPSSDVSGLVCDTTRAA